MHAIVQLARRSTEKMLCCSLYLCLPQLALTPQTLCAPEICSLVVRVRCQCRGKLRYPRVKVSLYRRSASKA
jgi:hypothetical protein